MVVIDKVTNVYPFNNGADEESLADRKRRFQNYVNSLSKGTREAITYGATEVEGVQGVYVDDTEIGLVKVFAHDSSGNLPNPIKVALEKHLRNYKSAGVEVMVLPVVTIELDIEVEITIVRGYDKTLFENLVTSSIVDLLNSFSVSTPLVKSALIQYLRNLDINAIIDVNIVDPSSNVLVESNQLIRPRGIAVTILD